MIFILPQQENPTNLCFFLNKIKNYDHTQLSFKRNVLCCTIQYLVEYVRLVSPPPQFLLTLLLQSKSVSSFLTTGSPNTKVACSDDRITVNIALVLRLEF